METREKHKTAIGVLIDKLIKNNFQFDKSDKKIVENAMNYISNNEYIDFDNNLKRIYDNAVAVAKMPPTALVNNIKNCLIKKNFERIGDLFSHIKGLGVVTRRKQKTKSGRKQKTKSRRNIKRKRKTRQYGGNGDCTICYDSLSDDANGVQIILHDSHSFHLNCIANWFNANNTCPNCREVINPIPELLLAKLDEMRRNRRINNGNGYNAIFWVVMMGIAAFVYYMAQPSPFPFDPNAPYSVFNSDGNPNPNYDHYAIDSYHYDGSVFESPYYIFNRPP